jgi:thiol-disulfide isomerase/thioredoxin
LILLFIGAVYGLYTKYFEPGEIPTAGIPTGRYTLKPIPAYMIEGPVNLEKMIVKGKTNIIDFYSEYCPPCKKIAPYLRKLDEKSIPYFIVISPWGKLICKGKEAYRYVVQQMRVSGVAGFGH